MAQWVSSVSEILAGGVRAPRPRDPSGQPNLHNGTRGTFQPLTGRGGGRGSYDAAWDPISHSVSQRGTKFPAPQPQPSLSGTFFFLNWIASVAADRAHAGIDGCGSGFGGPVRPGARAAIWVRPRCLPCLSQRAVSVSVFRTCVCTCNLVSLSRARTQSAIFIQEVCSVCFPSLTFFFFFLS